MTHRLLILAVACSLVLAGCLGGGFENAVGDSADSTTAAVETTAVEAPETEATATETTATETTPTETITDSAPERDRYDSYDDLAEGAPFSIPDPDAPERFAFQSGLVMSLADSMHVALAYHDTDGGEVRNVLSVRKAEGESLYERSVGNETTVSDREAKYVTDDDGSRSLVWACGDYSYRVSVQEFDDGFGEESLRSVAESVGCE